MSPPVARSRVRPLIDGAETFPALEALAWGARTHLSCAFRIFDPATDLHHPDLTGRGLHCWGDLIAAKLAQGVTVRIALGDFDPLGQAWLHRRSWRHYRAWMARYGTAPTQAAGRLELVCALHPARAGALVRLGAWPMLAARAAKETRRLNRQEPRTQADELACMPGLWRHVRQRRGGLRPRLWPMPDLWPCTHHHKLMIADNESAILGGLDVNDRRYDGRGHDRPWDETWHDISCQLDGPAVADCAAFFARYWQSARLAFDSAVATWGKSRGAPPISLTGTSAAPRAPQRPRVQPDTVAIASTESRRRAGPLALGPRAVRTTLNERYHQIIAQADRFLYIETQFLRHRPIAEALAARAKARPDLQLILLLPLAPAGMVLEGRDDPALYHGEALQLACLDRVADAFGSRVGIYGLVKQVRSKTADGRAQAYGRGLIYVHSKLMIADDRRCLIGSANLNGRSLMWDTEIGLDWQDDPGIGAFRRRLWARLMPNSGTADWAEDRYVQAWQDVAETNMRAEEPYDGFVVPFQTERTRGCAKRSRLVPDAFV